jgi:hypothetical protein
MICNGWPAATATAALVLILDSEICGQAKAAAKRTEMQSLHGTGPRGALECDKVRFFPAMGNFPPAAGPVLSAVWHGLVDLAPCV